MASNLEIVTKEECVRSRCLDRAVSCLLCVVGTMSSSTLICAWLKCFSIVVLRRVSWQNLGSVAIFFLAIVLIHGMCICVSSLDTRFSADTDMFVLCDLGRRAHNSSSSSVEPALALSQKPPAIKVLLRRWFVASSNVDCLWRDWGE